LRSFLSLLGGLFGSTFSSFSWGFLFDLLFSNFGGGLGLRGLLGGSLSLRGLLGGLGLGWLDLGRLLSLGGLDLGWFNLLLSWGLGLLLGFLLLRLLSFSALLSQLLLQV